ncbi:IniB N-terminal domain-containing protein [Blastococcus sp. SYSU D00669]
MSNLVVSLMDFILDLLRDPKAAADFERDPHAALESAGLAGTTPADVDAAMGAMADCSPVRDWDGGHGYGGHGYGGHGYGHKPDRDDDDHVAGWSRPWKRDDDDCDDDHKPHVAPWRGHDDDCDDDHEPHHGQAPWHGDNDGHGHEIAVIQHLQYIQHTYTIDKSTDVWVNGDVNVLFGDDNVLATNGAVALGEVEDVHELDIDTTNIDVDVKIEDSFNGSFNENNGDGNVNGVGNHVDNSEDNSEDNDTTTITVDDINLGDHSGNNEGATNSGNEDSVVGNSGSTVENGDGDQHIGDSTEVGPITVSDVNVATNGGQIAEQGGQNADEGGVNASDGGHVVNDSFNPENSFNDEEYDVEVEDLSVVVDSPDAVVGNDLSIEDNNLAGGDIDDSEDVLSENAVAVDHAAANSGDLELGLVP